MKFLNSLYLKKGDLFDVYFQQKLEESLLLQFANKHLAKQSYLDESTILLRQALFRKSYIIILRGLQRNLITSLGHCKR